MDIGLLSCAYIFLVSLALVAAEDVDFNVTEPSNTTDSSTSTFRRKLTNQETSELLDHLLDGMDHRVRPNVDGEPIVVGCGVHVINFGSISESDMEYSMDLYLRQQWHDSRLAFPPDFNTTSRVSISPSMMDSIWTPDASFPYEKHAAFHDIPVPNRMMRVSPTGDVLYSMRLTLTLACPMHLTHFPMDHQTCDFTINSYSNDVEDLVLEWFKKDPIKVEDGIELPQFRLDNVTIEPCAVRVHLTGRFSCLTAKFVLTRQFGFYLLQTYVPSILIVIISWVSFWINKDAVPARCSLGVTTVLTMATQLSGSKASIPRISYPKAIDVWMVTCMIFVFAALIEYAIVNNLTRKETKREAAKKKSEELLLKSKDEEALDNGADGGGDKEDNFMTQQQRRLACLPDIETAPPLDKTARWLFPLVFLIYNIIYWSVYSN